MPSKEDHLEKARENQRFAESFELHSRTEREWSVTIRFYAGVHYLQAYLESKSARTSTHSETRKKIRAMAELHDLEVVVQFDFLSKAIRALLPGSAGIF